MNGVPLNTGIKGKGLFKIGFSSNDYSNPMYIIIENGNVTKLNAPWYAGAITFTFSDTYELIVTYSGSNAIFVLSKVGV